MKKTARKRRINVNHRAIPLQQSQNKRNFLKNRFYIE